MTQERSKKSGGKGADPSPPSPMAVETVPIDSISPDPANARKHGARNLETVIASFRRFGQQIPILVDKSNVVRAGNCRLEAAKQLGWDTIQIVRTDLTSSEAIAYAIADNRTAELAEWDDDVLAAQLNGLLAEDEELLASAGFTDEELEELLGEFGDEALGVGAEDSQYTAKIEAPIYEPKGERPPLSELADKAKTIELCEEIASAEIPEEIKAFLTTAAQRHTVFNFRNIAEYYCHASPEVQHLMERSGLIIIDFQKAIQNGFVHLSERLGQIADLELSEGGDDA
jgi:hypothetical protein